MSEYYISRDNKIQRSFNITETNGMLVYVAKQKLSLLTESYNITDVDGNTVASIKRIINFIVPSYRIDINGESPIYIKRKIGFTVTYIFKNRPWVVKSDKQYEKYLLDDYDENTLYVIVKQRKRGQSDYFVENLSKNNDLYGLCAALAIDSAVRAISGVR